MAQQVAKLLVLGWNILWIVLLIVWLQNPALEAGTFSGGPFTTGPREYPPTKPPDWFLFQTWVVGMVVLAGVWVTTRWWHRRRTGQVAFPHAD